MTVVTAGARLGPASSQPVLTLSLSGLSWFSAGARGRVQPAPTRFSSSVTPYVRPPSPFFPACSPTTAYPASS